MFHIRRLYTLYQQPNDMELYSTELLNITSNAPKSSSSFHSALNGAGSGASASVGQKNGKGSSSTSSSHHSSTGSLLGNAGTSYSGGNPFGLARKSPFSSGYLVNSSPLVNSNCKIAAHGTHVAMGVKNGLLLINLPEQLDKKSPLSVHHLTNDSKFETSQVQFNPLRSNMLGSTMTNVIQVWDIERMQVSTQQKAELPSEGVKSTPQKRSLIPPSVLSGGSNHAFETHPPNEYLAFSISQAHDRAITDIGWCPKDENLLASCSADTCIRFWDIRTPSNDIKTFCAYTGASILRWHPTEYKVATAHDGEVRIWDMRKQSAYKPVQFLTAHTERLTSLDWSPSKPYEILTTAQDRLIKLWNINSPEEPVISSGVQYPVRMARYTPFGDGIATVAKTQDLAIRIWKPDRELGKLNHIHAFLGHSDDIKSFDFRTIPMPDTLASNEEEEVDYQIVSWSKDWKIKVWRCDSNLRHSLSFGGDTEPLSPNSAAMSQQQYLSKNASHNSSKSRLSNNEYISFEDECNHIPELFLHQVELLNLNEDDRECLLQIHFPDDSREAFQLHIEYPVGYPTYTQPKFTLKNANHSPKLFKNLHKIMEQTAESSLVMHDFCTNKVLKKVLSHLQKLPRPIRTSPLERSSSSPGNADASFNTPAPRTSQAIFTPTGHLLYFNNFSKRTNVTVRKRMAARRKIPRTYEQFKSVLSKSRTRSEKINKQSQVSYIFEHVFTSEFNSADDLSAHQNNTNPPKNALTTVASSEPFPSRIDNRILIYDFRHLFPISYTLATELKVDGSNIQEICMHNRDVCLKAGLKSAGNLWMIISHIADSFLCANPSSSNVPWASHPCGRRTIKSIMDHLFKKRDIQSIAIISCVLSIPQRVNTGRSLGLARSLSQQGENNLIGSDQLKLYNTVRMYYSEILHRWGLDCQRNELLKFVHTTQSKEQALESKSFVIVSRVKCSICHVPAKGLCMVCVNCGHGGHFDHMVPWFEKVDMCPTGCGCACAEYMSSVLAPHSEHMAPSKAHTSGVLSAASHHRRMVSTSDQQLSSSTSTTSTASPGWQKLIFGRFGGAPPRGGTTE
eukprot:CAMPEP_0117439336 /NCGR_PEP_ID=MMETSP0759-20121206/2513_1 /TAXON_ID=63605 /ORGANISM="Percolomonas cosmopolitus, Strain WS" /LENGTH=1072 /DNA_ID=CAMNT_0005231049 /DNA_START=356 /DNA_END=3575 /DNA_ORIENTATION=-